MGLTVKVNGTMNGLVHKGSSHLAKNTAPDVCKTPSPGGPVPVPYPVIISKSSDLANGTTTVKADGGQMIAVKDCEYATCNGDEAGTAGGVVSSTNMKEAKFILYSFDVKMDGKNACRHGDKMTMNHQNTACLLGTFPTSVTVLATFPLDIDCSEKRKNNDWDDCMVEELCAKVDGVNNAKNKKLIRPSPGNVKSPFHKDYCKGIEQFNSDFTKLVKEKGPDAPEVKEQFESECRYKEWKEARGDNPDGSGLIERRLQPGPPPGRGIERVAEYG